MADEHLDGGAVMAVAALTRDGSAKPVTIGGREYATAQVYDPRKEEPVPKNIGLRTLDSFAEYVRSKHDEAYRTPRRDFVHVFDPTTVFLRTGVFGEMNQRTVIAQADATVPTIKLGSPTTQEDFVIQLLTLFEPTEERERLFRIVGNLKAGLTQTRVDDGVSQEATVSKGIRMERAGVVNPFNLRPYRTFAEVDQPTSAFWLRLGTGGEAVVPTVALHECDGGRWRLDAVRAIKEYLTDALPGVSVYG